MGITENTVPKHVKSVVDRQPKEVVIYSKDQNKVFQPLTYGDFWEKVKAFGTGLLEMGFARGQHIGIISENRTEWLITDLAVLGIGAIDVPRGNDSTAEEIKYILRHADCPAAFVENAKQLEKVLSIKVSLPLLKRIIVLDSKLPESIPNSDNIEILSFNEILDKGKKAVQKKPELFHQEMAKGKTEDIATIIYTSGTTGEPKGVMLTHHSFLFQVFGIDGVLFLGPGVIFLSVLPIWHSFERAVNYIVLHKGAAIAYSKPIGKIMLTDMETLKPQWMTSVPRIWEGIRSAVLRKITKSSGIKKFIFHTSVSIGEIHANVLSMFRGLLPEFQKRTRVFDVAISIIPLIILTPLKILGDVLVFNTLKKRLGGRFVAGVSGGGAMPPYVDRFFQAAGIKVLEGYGLTETGPILSVRKQKEPVPDTVGPLLRGIEYRIIGENGEVLEPGRKGVLHVKSPQVMKGYYKKPEETEKVLKDGWLNTGDLAMVTYNRELKIMGRAKDTIVLMGGENIEPTPIEDKLLQSSYIMQAMVVGQDKKFLGALIIPEMERIEEFAAENDINYIDQEELINNPRMQELIHDEIQSLINPKNGFKSFERIYRFTLLSSPFEVGKELTHTQKIRRNIVHQEYKYEIHKLFE
ncbi:MAG: AMP-dependent synthetase/ligase [Spirochaetia bacterium]